MLPCRKSSLARLDELIDVDSVYYGEMVSGFGWCGFVGNSEKVDFFCCNMIDVVQFSCGDVCLCRMNVI